MLHYPDLFIGLSFCDISSLIQMWNGIYVFIAVDYVVGYEEFSEKEGTSDIVANFVSYVEF